MLPEILALMCKDMIKNLDDCLEVLESPVIHERDQLSVKWAERIQEAYKILGKD